MTNVASHGWEGMVSAWVGRVSTSLLARAPGAFLLIRAPGPAHPA